MTIEPGTKLGPYEIRSLLGEGGMGVVFRARDTRLQRDVAIKVLPQSLARDTERLQRFEQEARAVAALNHPNLLIVFDVGTMPLPEGTTAQGHYETAPYLVSELLEGSTLRERLISGPLPERRAVEYAVQIARGLAAAHDRGIIHRDIKPENIFLTNDGRVKILDFGLAKLTQVDAPSGSGSNETILETQAMHTRADVVMGTAGYMAPEQLRGKTVDARSDIFSFGAVLYEMLSGRRAFTGESGADVMSAILNHEPPELVSDKLTISPGLDHIVRRCLEKDPQQRFQSAGDLAFALQELSGMRSSSTTGAMPKLAERKRMAIPAWLLTIASVLVSVLLTWHFTKASESFTPPTFTQITFQQGFVHSAKFLHDGQTIVSASRWGSESDYTLHVGSVNTVGVRSLDTPAEYVLSVSVNDDILLLNKVKSVGPGYVAVGTLSQMHYGGGAPRPLLENVQYADWDPEGKKFAIVRFVPEKHVYRLEYPVDTVLYETDGWISDPRFARDGKSIAFLDHSLFGDDQGNVATVTLHGKVTKWKGNFASAQKLVWSPDGKQIWFSAQRQGVHRSLWTALADGAERPLLTAPGTMDVEDALPNGRVLVSNLSERRVQMIVTPEFPEPRDYTWMDWAYGAAFTADGKQLLFGDQHSGEFYGSFLRNVDGSPAVKLGDGDPLGISPDGKYAVSRLPNEEEQLMLLPTGTGDQRPLTHTRIKFTRALWISNEQFLALGNEPGHPQRMFLIDLQGNIKPFTAEGTLAAAVTADGKRMLVGSVASDGLIVRRVIPVEPEGGGGEGITLPQMKPNDRVLDFNLDGTAFYFARILSSSTFELWQQDIATGKQTLLHTVAAPGIPAITNGLNGAISRDGKSYAYQYHPALSTEYVIDGLR